MSDVEFSDEQYNRGVEFNVQKPSVMVKWVMKTGLVRGEKQANIVLVILSVIFLVSTFVVITSGLNTAPQITYREDIPEDVLSELPPEILKTIPSRN